MLNTLDFRIVRSRCRHSSSPSHVKGKYMREPRLEDDIAIGKTYAEEEDSNDPDKAHDELYED